MNFLIQTVLFSLLILNISCSSKKPKGKTEAEVLYKEALQLVEEERYLVAIDKLNQLKNQYPYSFYATPAELLQADILYKQENYVEAAAAYMLFRDFHPKHEKIDYVVSQIGNAYYMQIPDTFDRDLQAAFEAVKYFKELIQNYPGSKYTREVQEKIESALKKIRQKQQYIADFYYKTEVYSAARWRYLDILENFGKKDLREHSMKRIVQSSYYMKDYKGCVDYSTRYWDNLSKKSHEDLDDIVKKCKAKVN